MADSSANVASHLRETLRSGRNMLNTVMICHKVMQDNPEQMTRALEAIVDYFDAALAETPEADGA